MINPTPSNIAEAVHQAALLGRALGMPGSKTAQMRETALLIAEAWAEVCDLPFGLRFEAANTFVLGAQGRDVDPVIVAMDVLEDRRVKHLRLYGWPEVDAETVEAMAVRAARIWTAREGL